MQNHDKTNSSQQTVLGIFNSIVGGAMLTFPILYRSAGLVTSSIALLLSGLISYATCRIYVLHMSDSDKNVQGTIRRILGRKWQYFFRIISGFYLILLCVIYFDLIVDQLYSIIYFFFDRYNNLDHITPKDAFAFNKFSIQWLTIIIFIPMLSLAFIKKLHIMVKLSSIGAYSSIIYFIYVIYKFIDSAANNQIDIDQINWFSYDIGNLAGTCAFAFTVHTLVVTFLKSNKHQQNNTRDLGLAYLLAFILYECIGVLGAFATSSKDCKETLINCYLNQGLILIVQVCYLFGRVTVFPCTLEVSRTRLIEMFLGKVDDISFRNFNIGFMIIASMFSILNPFLPITLMMNMVGAVVCYFFIYLIPSALHYRCLYLKKETKQSLFESSSTEYAQSQTTVALPVNICCRHDPDYKNRNPWIIRAVIYGLINIIGVATGIYGIYNCVLQVIG